ncbi:DUF523 and DUF1722 domain-containing protein [Lentisphaera profundi]|uniref:DUF523 and DUF1722 domain-containing protein n=1 Tax=Lentisphaera profundi TaxID=1658616 RepID=A0ABY7VYM3_9BACT|nr:DUF523 and DUF1722 domain-containing protein [Lentisphaera profundi]WDE99001.1 DUF523 and DUF1722 domain-containing protein [Lentisphaera profundi]
MSKIKIGLSACLAGENVRYNGQNSLNKLITQDLEEYFEYVKVCPEVAIGMGTPRETIRVVRDGELQLRASRSNTDYSKDMRDFAKADMKRVADADLCGFIFKKGSPSCGVFRVKIYNTDGMPQVEKTSGFYAAQVMESFPWLPVEEEGRLNDPPLFENFIQKTFALGHWKEMLKEGLSHKGLLDFHQYHKYWIMAHNQAGLKRLGKMLANRGERSVEELASEYLKEYSEIVHRPPTSLKHSNVLYHLLGYFKQDIDSFDKGEMVKLIEQYRENHIPLVVPITRLAYFAKKYKQEYLLNQSYLRHPENLGVLNRL